MVLQGFGLKLQKSLLRLSCDFRLVVLTNPTLPRRKRKAVDDNDITALFLVIYSTSNLTREIFRNSRLSRERPAGLKSKERRSLPRSEIFTISVKLELLSGSAGDDLVH